MSIDIEAVSKRIADRLASEGYIGSGAEEGATAYIAAELTEALKPAEGSWEWALEQMKAEGKVRTHDMIAGAYLELCPDGFIHCEMPDDEDGKGFTFDIGDFSETCWQLATPSTAESTAPGPRQGLQE